MKCANMGVIAAMWMALGGAGCVSTPQPEEVGQLVVPLKAVGTGGVTYRLPPNTWLQLRNAERDIEISLDGDAPSLTAEVIPGEYSVSLEHEAGYTTVWPLLREGPRGTETVSATLQLAPTVAVADGQTTSLLILFQVAGVVQVTFAVGALDVTMAVESIVASSLTFQLAVPSSTVTSLGLAPTTPAALVDRLPARGNTNIQSSLTVETIGPWTLQAPRYACAEATGSYHVDGHLGFIQAAAEAPPSALDRVCVEEIDGFAIVTADFTRTGSPLTSLLADLGPSRFSVQHGIAAAFADTTIFNGRTLDLRPLLGAQPTSSSAFAQIVAHVDGRFEVWTTIQARGSGSFTLTPNL